MVTWWDMSSNPAPPPLVFGVAVRGRAPSAAPRSITRRGSACSPPRPSLCPRTRARARGRRGDARGGMRFEVVSVVVVGGGGGYGGGGGVRGGRRGSRVEASRRSSTSWRVVSRAARRSAALAVARGGIRGGVPPGRGARRVLDFGDGPTLALLAAQAGARGVLNLERTPLAAVTSRDACARSAEEEEAPAPGIPP